MSAATKGMTTLEAATVLLAAERERVKDLEARLGDIVANARLVRDPTMGGAADAYMVPMDDILNAELALYGKDI